MVFGRIIQQTVERMKADTPTNHKDTVRFENVRRDDDRTSEEVLVTVRALAPTECAVSFPIPTFSRS